MFFIHVHWTWSFPTDFHSWLIIAGFQHQVLPSGLGCRSCPPRTSSPFLMIRQKRKHPPKMKEKMLWELLPQRDLMFSLMLKNQKQLLWKDQVPRQRRKQSPRLRVKHKNQLLMMKMQMKRNLLWKNLQQKKQLLKMKVKRMKRNLLWKNLQQKNSCWRWRWRGWSGRCYEKTCRQIEADAIGFQGYSQGKEASC